MSKDPKWDDLERKNLLLQIELLKKAAGDPKESCAILVEELERWRIECETYLKDTKGKWHARIQNQRKELSRLQRKVNELYGIVYRYRFGKNRKSAIEFGNLGNSKDGLDL